MLRCLLAILLSHMLLATTGCGLGENGGKSTSATESGSAVVTTDGPASESVSADDSSEPGEADHPEADPALDSQVESSDGQADKWISLFDGKTLEGWQKTEFGGEGDVYIEDGALFLGTGYDMTGVHTARELPRVDYEMTFEAQRVEGSDFFVGLTFPVEDDPCTLILGGWGGGLTGLSSIDNMDASENDTTDFYDFKNGVWYKIRLVVSGDNISVWVNDDQIIDQGTEGRKIGIRFEVEPSQPLGFASFQTEAALRKIRLRPLKDDSDGAE